LPAVVEDPDLAEALGLTLEVPTDEKVVKQFGSKPMSALWPGRKSLPLLAEAKRADHRVFGALYMGQPTPDDGDYFKLDNIVEYGENELPSALYKYGASDHAVGMKQQHDDTVLGCVGVDPNDDIWILPDLVMDRFPTDRTVEEMIALMKRHKPMMWWMESELISKSFGPFLRKRMHEDRIYTYIDPVTVSADKMKRARAIQGRMSMRKVHFPRFAPWYSTAKAQLLKFPNGTHDDFVDWLAHIGQGMTKEIPAEVGEKVDGEILRQGSPKWIMAKAKEKFSRDSRLASTKGW
jgi:predicted phage terminase large subunit-like protein